MSKRLQVVVDDEEWAAVREAADAHGVSVSEWVRQTLREAQRRRPSGDVAAKLAAVRVAARHEFPTADIGQMIQEIERGYA